MPAKFTRQIKIDGDVLSLFEKDKCIKSASLSAVSKVFYGPLIEPMEFGLLPRGVRWISSDRHSFLLERKPDVQMVSLLMPGRYLKLPMPHQVLVVRFDEAFNKVVKLAFGFSNRPVQSLYEEVIPFPGRPSIDYDAAEFMLIKPGVAFVGENLANLWGFIDKTMYKAWAAKKIEPKTLPFGYEFDPKDKDKFIKFATWWAEQTLESVQEWSYPEFDRIGLKEVLTELDARPDYEGAWDFFDQLVEKANPTGAPKKKKASGISFENLAS